MADNDSQEEAPIPVNGFEHVAIAVPDLDAAMAFYREHFGCEVTEPVVVETQLVRMAYVELGNAKIELMEPTSEKSPIARFIERNPNGGIHHICLRVPDVPAAAEGASETGLRVLGDGKPVKGYEGQDLFFMHPKDTLGTLIEIE
ncbi:MAG TPA: methylmalonyl-CoA epimerase [Rhodospirillaceae bacterium]|nr:methylmalonyl-CoA epimerase [Rhodospirillaceae bacterium]HAA90848.1 methylmalonyl-CoA epimerase [Rhodospirillaceae bacterium]HAT34935.1 methylmalonyl-CoA epimerase [Rhodospirillaceae bacterium]|tara:strand:+ start:621 stop:1055 length:435 start_codon:yes stop_codon:yes gene_type:complete